MHHSLFFALDRRIPFRRFDRVYAKIMSYFDWSRYCTAKLVIVIGTNIVDYDYDYIDNRGLWAVGNARISASWIILTCRFHGGVIG